MLRCLAYRFQAPLAERLGTEGARALSGMIESAHAEWTEDMLMLAEERFARGLTVEVSKLRVDFGRDLSDIRQDLGRHAADVRQDLATAKVEMFKWSFVFWIGQAAAIAGLLALMLGVGG